MLNVFCYQFSWLSKLKVFPAEICFLGVALCFLHEQTTMTALEEMFEAARGIMDWLGDCAKVCVL